MFNKKLKVMKKMLAAFLMLFLVTSVFAQSNDAEKIIGTYMTDGNEGKVLIAKKNNKFYGTLVWTNIPDALDKNNPDEGQRKNKLAGQVVLKDLEYTGKNVWENGTIYDPNSGKTYKCKVTIDAKGNLKVRGFIGISLAGKTTIWTKVK